DGIRDYKVTGVQTCALPILVFDHAETAVVCDYIRGNGDRDAFLARFAKASSPGFDPDRDLEHIGLANQTTMLMTESLEIGEQIRSEERRVGKECRCR